MECIIPNGTNSFQNKGTILTGKDFFPKFIFRMRKLVWEDLTGGTEWENVVTSYLVCCVG